MSKPNFLDSFRRSYKVTDKFPDEVIAHSTRSMAIISSANENQTSISTKTKFLNNKNVQKYFGIFLALLASCLIALYQVIVRSLPSKYDPFDVSIWRFMGMLLPSVPFLFCTSKKSQETSFPNGNSKLRLCFFLIMSAIISGTSILLDVTALHYISASDTSVIIAATPIAVTFFSHFLIQETMGIVSIMSSGIVLIGITIVTKPSFIAQGVVQNSTHIIGVLAAIGCMLANSFDVITLRYLKHVNLALIGVVTGFWNTVLCFGISLYLGVLIFPHSGLVLLKVIGLCVASSAGIFCMYFSLKLEDATTVALLRATTPIFVCAFEYLMLNVLPDLFSLIGGFFVVFGIVILLGFRKWKSKLPQENALIGKRWFKYL